MQLKDLSTADRPREKLLKFGAAYLTNSELLSLLLGTSGVRNRNVLDLAREVLGDTGNLRGLASREVDELAETKGVGPAKAVIIQSLFELAHRFEEERLPLPKYFHSPAEIVAHFASRFRDAKREVFNLLCLNARQKLLGQKELSTGMLDAVGTNPREIFGEALRCSAAGIILIHNHPSGDATPSKQDKKVTTDVRASGKLLGVPLLDHIILGDGNYFSFQEAGII